MSRAGPGTVSGPQPTEIRPGRSWRELGISELWNYRELVWFLAGRNIKVRYRQMALGPLWILIKPALSAIILSIVFGRIARLPSEGIPYPIFALTALLPWQYFSTAIAGSSGSLVSQMNLVSKVYFPRLAVPIAVVLAALADLAFASVVLIGMMVYYDFAPTWSVVYLPAYVVLAAITGLGVGLWTATLSVRYRDTRFVIAQGTQIWMYLTPVAYSADLVPERWLWVYRLNPMYWVVEGFRGALVGTGTVPDTQMLLAVALAALSLISGALVFRRTERTIVDLL